MPRRTDEKPQLTREFFRQKGKERWKGVSKEARQHLMAAAGKAAWAKLSKEERSAEMKRRAAKRGRKRKRF